MKDKINQIKDLLSQIEDGFGDEQGQQFSKNYSALELPSIVSSIVEYCISSQLRMKSQYIGI
jgi:hypothetical protein